MSPISYKVIRFFAAGERNRVIKRGLTLEEAKRHCSDPATHEFDKSGRIAWFDGFEEE